MHLGQYNKLTILRFTNPGAYLGDDEDNDGRLNDVGNGTWTVVTLYIPEYKVK